MGLAATCATLFFGDSGTLTLASPELARRYALPAIKRWSATARAAGVPTVLGAASSGGGFILSTGNQYPRDTPDENLFALHRAVADAGVY